MDPFTFIEFKQIIILELDHNQLKSIQYSTFSPIMISIRELSICNNLLENIDSFTFQNLTRLYSLYLKYNLITNINKDSFNTLTSLEMLDLSHNKIKELSLDLIGLNKLIFLNLEFNNLNQFHLFINDDDSMKHFKKLYLNNNNLVELNNETFHNRIELICLNNNPNFKLDMYRGINNFHFDCLIN